MPVPVKGSNWIPADAFESRVSRDKVGTTRLDKLFVSLKTSHQNMIRNWGGGIYQRESFYDLAVRKRRCSAMLYYKTEHLPRQAPERTDIGKELKKKTVSAG